MTEEDHVETVRLEGMHIYVWAWPIFQQKSHVQLPATIVAQLQYVIF